MNINTITIRRRIQAFALILAAAFVLFAGGVGRASADIPVVLPLDQPHFGKTYGEWAATWWQWAYKYPVKINPLFDETGERAQLGNQGQVFFLGGVFNVSGTAVRTIKVPANKALFFPVLNYEADNFFNTPAFDPPKTLPELRLYAKNIMDSVSALDVELDGNAIPNVACYRVPFVPSVSCPAPSVPVPSPVFGIHMPQNNIQQFFGYSAPPGEYAPIVDDGYYIMLAPPSPGQHTLHFSGTLPGFTLDIIYNITVVQGG